MKYLVTVAATRFDSEISGYRVYQKLGEHIVDETELGLHLASYGFADRSKASDYMHEHGRLVRWDVIDASPPVLAFFPCEQCGIDVARIRSNGRRAKYCSQACRQAAFRARHNAVVT